MTPVELFGWTAAVLGVLSNLPQLARLLRTRTTLGVSTRSWQIAGGTTGAWAFHGFYVGVEQMQVPNILLTATALWILLLIARERRESFWLMLPLPFAVILAGAATDVLFGSAVYGAVIAVPPFLGTFAQLRAMMRSFRVDGVSGPFLALALLVQWLWLTWGIIEGEWAIRIAAGSLSTMMAVSFAYYLHRLRRDGPLDGTPGPAQPLPG